MPNTKIQDLRPDHLTFDRDLVDPNRLVSLPFGKKHFPLFEDRRHTSSIQLSSCYRFEVIQVVLLTYSKLEITVGPIPFSCNLASAKK